MTCLDCKHCTKGAVDKQTLRSTSHCTRYPPQCIPIASPQGIQLLSAHPVVDKTTFVCAEYAAKLLGLAAH